MGNNYKSLGTAGCANGPHTIILQGQGVGLGFGLGVGSGLGFFGAAKLDETKQDNIKVANRVFLSFMMDDSLLKID